MRMRYILTLTLFLTTLLVFSKNYSTKTYSENIKTLKVSANNDWQQHPIIEFNGENFININFDKLGSHEYQNLKYSILYCNADWSLSATSEIEYLDGFNNQLIYDYEESVNTTVSYTNYNIKLPNENQKLKLSGNYVIYVYDENQVNDTLLTACFSILDPEVRMEGKVSSITDIGANKEHQQVSFKINTSAIQIQDVLSDLIVSVQQNRRVDNMVSNIKPTYIRFNELIYEHNKNLIFESGNEYRRFESVSYRYNGLNIENTAYQGSSFYTTIVPDKVRAQKRYVYDQDQNGSFFIRNAEANDEFDNSSADYFITNFTLIAPTPFPYPIFINGEFSYNEFTPQYLMEYDAEKGIYHKSILLKQGVYNYQYLAKKGNNFTASVVEGNYYETNNEYYVLVYYRPKGQQRDLLIGKLLIDDK